MKKIDLSNFQLRDIENNVIPPQEGQEWHKGIANALYVHAQSIELAELAKKIHQGEEVELRDEEIESIKAIVSNQQLFPYTAMVSRQVLAFLG